MRNPKPRGRAVQSAAPVARLRNFYVAFAVIALLIVVGVVYNIYGNTAEPVKTLEATIPAPRTADIPMGKTDDGRYYLGKPDAAVTVVEYADYQCPGCAFYSNLTGAGFPHFNVVNGAQKIDCYYDSATGSTVLAHGQLNNNTVIRASVTYKIVT